MKKVNIYVSGSVRWAAYKKDEEYQSWIDAAVAANLWGQPGTYTVEVVDATAELEQIRASKEGAKKQDLDSHTTDSNNPHQVTKGQVGLGDVDNVSASSLRDRSTHTGTQLASTISDFNESAQDAVGIALNSSVNIILTYPDAQNQISADLSDTGVQAGTYNLVTVDTKGRITSGTTSGPVTRYAYSTSAANANTNATYTSVAELTTINLPVGLYRFTFRGLMQSAATNSGVGVRISNVTATLGTTYGQWRLKQAANGTAAIFVYDQLANNTNVTSASVAAANSNFVVAGEGIFSVSSAGTVAIQIRGETNGTAATLQPGAVFTVELI